MRTRGLAALLSAAMLAACGSDSKSNDPSASRGIPGSSSELNATQLTPDSEPTADDGSSATNGPPLSGEDSAPSGAARRDASSTSPAATPSDSSGRTAESTGPIPGRHPGVTDTSINFGFIYTEGAGDFASAIGANASSGNTKRQIEAVVEAVNQRGGIAGRKVNLLAYPFRAGQPIEPQLQAACEHFTKDNHALAVSANNGANSTGNVLHRCLTSRGVAYIESVGAGDSVLFDEHPNLLYAPGSLTADRGSTVLVDALVHAGWFGTKPVIGLHTNESPMWRRVVEHVVKPRLAEHGYTVTEEFYFRIGPNGPDNAADYGAATLRFKGSGVTHIVNLGNHPLLFARFAEAQNYRPKWSVSSDSPPNNWVKSVPPEQLVGSLGIGYSPSRDLDPGERGDPPNDAARRCEAIMRDAGEDTTPALAWQYQLTACGPLFFMENALARAPEVSADGLAAGTAALARTHLDPSTWTTSFEAGRRDGLGAYKLLGYVQDCTCYRYASDLQSTG